MLRMLKMLEVSGITWLLRMLGMLEMLGDAEQLGPLLETMLAIFEVDKEAMGPCFPASGQHGDLLSSAFHSLELVFRTSFQVFPGLGPPLEPMLFDGLATGEPD